MHARELIERLAAEFTKAACCWERGRPARQACASTLNGLVISQVRL